MEDTDFYGLDQAHGQSLVTPVEAPSAVQAVSPSDACNGYDKTGKKKYLRFFKIEKLKKI